MHNLDFRSADRPGTWASNWERELAAGCLERRYRFPALVVGAGLGIVGWAREGSVRRELGVCPCLGLQRLSVHFGAIRLVGDNVT